MKPDEILDNTYRIVREIGRGGSGAIFLAYHLRLRKYIVLKRVAADADGAAQIRREVDFLKELHHECLPQVYDFFVLGQQAFTVMDYIEGKNLEEWLSEYGSPDESLLRKWFFQLAQVLDYLHTRPIPILHSDIKPANIIITREQNLCLIDFNVSLYQQEPNRMLGYSRSYAAPELLEMAQALLYREVPKWRLDGRMDLYSAGASIYFLMTGHAPNPADSSPLWSDRERFYYSEHLRRVIEKCFHQDRRKRYGSARKLMNALEQMQADGKRDGLLLSVQLGSVVLAVLLASVGTVFLLSGHADRVQEAYTAEYQSFLNAEALYGAETALLRGEKLLRENKYSHVLQERRGEYAYLLHELGNLCWNLSETDEAVEYYRQAVAACESNDANSGTYYYDYAYALLELNQLEEAKTVLQKGQEVLANTEALSLMQADIALRQGDTELCLSSVEELIEGDGAWQYGARACLIAAEAVGVDTEEGLQWLDRVESYSCEKREHRALAQQLLYASQRRSSAGESEALALRAKELYQALCEESSATLEDFLGYAECEYALGEDRACIQILRQCEENGEDDYRIYLDLTRAYLQLGQKTDALNCCKLALKKLDEERNPANPQNAQQARDELEELRRKLS